MTPEEQAAADAAAKAAAGTADAGTVKDTVSRAELLRAIEERDKLKAKVRDLTPLADAGQKALDANKTAEERLAAITGESAALKARAEKAEAAMTSRLAAEVESLPEALRGIIPESLDPADKLEWIGKARAAGIFGVKSASPGAELHGGQGGATVTQTEFLNSPQSKREHMRKQVSEGKLTVVVG